MTRGIMGKSSKKPRKKVDASQVEGAQTKKVKQEKDWSFDDIVRSKTRPR